MSLYFYVLTCLKGFLPLLTGPIFKDQTLKKVHKSTKTFFIKELSPLFIHSEYV